MMEDISEEINKKIENIKNDIYSGKISLLNLELNPIFRTLRKSLSVYNINNYTEPYRNTCELLNQKFEELKNLLNLLDEDKKFIEYLKSKPSDNELYQLFEGCWNKIFYIDCLSFKFMEYSKDRFCKNRKFSIPIEHLERKISDKEFLLKIPEQKFTEKMMQYFKKIKSKLPCKFKDIFEDDKDQIKIYENFVYILHLLQIGKIKYQKDTKTIYI